MKVYDYSINPPPIKGFMGLRSSTPGEAALVLNGVFYRMAFVKSVCCIIVLTINKPFETRQHVCAMNL